MDNVKDPMLHLRIPKEILKKYKILCIEKNLSLPKQTAALIKGFCENLERNKEFIR